MRINSLIIFLIIFFISCNKQVIETNKECKIDLSKIDFSGYCMIEDFDEDPPVNKKTKK